ncbi:MAG: NAD-dependent epimerase/dehydratase family protein, partial [Clostridia bacterium]|nr:NAD-dependent epimerase/dehydratase family protein [Clostridia bacterium]
MRLYEIASYQADLARLAALPLPWERLSNKSVLLSGASGMIGSVFVDALMQKNREGLSCRILALTRDPAAAAARFSFWVGQPWLRFIRCDVNDALTLPTEKADFVLHLASNTHPVQYASFPITTVMTNVIGLDHLLSFAAACGAERFAFASSNEIYGNGSEDTVFREGDLGYIDCNTLRAGYPESKRCGEALCQAYRAEKALDVVIPRFTRSYGPTMRPSDTKALSQFIKKAAAGEDIVLKSAGMQQYSFTHAADAAAGLLYVLLCGESGEAYNIADETGDARLRDAAELCAKIAG